MKRCAGLRWALLGAVVGIFSPGCGGTSGSAVDAASAPLPDGAAGVPDVGAAAPDASAVEPDAALPPPPDASAVEPDATAPPAPDASAVEPDATAPPPPDAGAVVPDAAPPPPPDAAVEPPRATDYDLIADFSSLSNPSGPWSFRAGDVPVPLFTRDWAGVAGQSAWASAPGLENGFTPAFMIVTSPDTGFVDVALGDFVVHSQDDGSGFGLGPARIVFTVPTEGTLEIAGAVWPGRDIGRADTWSLGLAGVELARGSLMDGDTYDRAHPADFAAAAGRPLAGLPVEPGDELVLEVVRASDFGDAVGVRLAVRLAESRPAR